MNLFRKRPSTDSGRWPLGLELIRWSSYRKDVWSLADAFQDVVVFGQKGSGKTSGSGRLFARKYLEAGFAGLVLCAQDDEAESWRGYLRETGREGDGQFFSLDGPFRFNPLAWEAQQSGGWDFSENVVNLLLDCSSVRKIDSSGPNEAAYWGPQRRKLLRNTVSLLMLAGEPVTLHSIYRIMTSAATSLEEAEDRRWQKGSYLFGLLTKAGETNGGHLDLDAITHYFLTEWAKLNPKTRTTVESDVTGLLDPLTRGKLAEVFGTTTTLSPDDIVQDGKVVIVDIPVLRYREIGQYAALLWIQAFQRAASRRGYQAPHNRPLFLYCDEAQYFTIEQDAKFQSVSRHYGISVCRLTQSIPGFRKAYGSQDSVDALLSHCGTKVFHLNSCHVTNEWASKVIGQEIQVKRSVSRNGKAEDRPQMSLSESQEFSCPSETFLDLKTGGKRNGGVVEAVVAQAGRTFLDGRRWIVSSYKQAKR